MQDQWEHLLALAYTSANAQASSPAVGPPQPHNGWNACGAVMDRTESTIDLTLNAAGVRLLLDAVCHQLDRWPGGDPGEQGNLQEMKTLLTAALLECTFQDI